MLYAATLSTCSAFVLAGTVQIRLANVRISRRSERLPAPPRLRGHGRCHCWQAVGPGAAQNLRCRLGSATFCLAARWRRTRGGLIARSEVTGSRDCWRCMTQLSGAKEEFGIGWTRPFFFR